MNKEVRRLFFALWPTATLQQTLVEQTRPLLGSCGGRQLAAEKLHITLAYFGLADEKVQACLEHVAAQIRSVPFSLSLSYFGFWPRPRVVWLAPVTAPPALTHLHTQLNGLLLSCGYKPDTRPYAPHMTLVRKATRAPVKTQIAGIEWPVDRFVLVESVSVERGVRYDVLRQWPLNANQV